MTSLSGLKVLGTQNQRSDTRFTAAKALPASKPKVEAQRVDEKHRALAWGCRDTAQSGHCFLGSPQTSGCLGERPEPEPVLPGPVETFYTQERTREKGAGRRADKAETLCLPLSQSPIAALGRKERRKPLTALLPLLIPFHTECRGGWVRGESRGSWRVQGRLTGPRGPHGWPTRVFWVVGGLCRSLLVPRQLRGVQVPRASEHPSRCTTALPGRREGRRKNTPAPSPLLRLGLNHSVYLPSAETSSRMENQGAGNSSTAEKPAQSRGGSTPAE